MTVDIQLTDKDWAIMSIVGALLLSALIFQLSSTRAGAWSAVTTVILIVIIMGYTTA